MAFRLLLAPLLCVSLLPCQQLQEVRELPGIDSTTPAEAAARKEKPKPAQWNKATEKSVDAGLAWLAGQMQSGGYWLGDVGHKQMDGYMVQRSVAEQRQQGQGHMGVTALCGMAFLAGGHLPDRGEYGPLVRKVTNYVLEHVQENGLISDSGSRMYSHAFATLFLAQVHGMAGDRKIKTALERAVHIIVDGQNVHGAWRYNPFDEEADLSVTVCQLQALRAARNIGIQIPRGTIDKAVVYLRASQCRSGRSKGLFYYKIRGRGAYRKNRQFSINAAAITALVSTGVYEKALINPALDFLQQEARQVTRDYPRHYYYWYGNYYACQALFHADGLIQDDCFGPYFQATRQQLLTSQASDGRWRNNVGPGDPFATAVACIVLQIPKQYLPIFQR